ncbi:hypothetical protein RJ639_018477 [Escallonia herrerae]|uniref:Thioredoxin domain-containing protein n=1 Tax=Escallonia herrerae TaxID=1293975 RepID=A0AA88V8U8_9ASTE|nr:hypothetical protein RJ639_018477 [Escallonia herrerae]
METLVSSSTIFYTFPIPPVRAVASSCPFHTTCSLSTSPSNKLSLRLRNQTKSNFFASSPSSRKLAVTCGVTEINDGQFSSVVLKSDLPVLVEFVAGWCGPCRLMAPAIDSIAQEYADRLLVVKIDHDSNPRLIEEFKVYGLPALILFKNGQEVPESRREGALTKIKLKEYLDALLESITVS